MSTVGERVTGKGLRAARSVTMLENGEQLFPEMLAAIAGAEDKIHLSSYIFDNDPTGNQFIEALCAARDRGVSVRIIVDALGEFMCLPRPRIGRKLARRGLQFARFNPIRLIPPAIHINMRNHRKILVVDGAIAFTGGQNIGNRQLAKRRDNSNRIADLHFKFTGKIVDELERAFLRDWYYAHGKKDPQPFHPVNANPSQSAIWTRLVLDGPNEFLDRLNDLLVGIISTARQRVWIMTPYFLPGPDIAAALVGARLRGVDVKLILPSKNNIFLVHWANQKILPYYLEKDIAIHFQPPPFAHTKAMIIDDNYSLVGSANLDARSLRLNFELGVEIFDPQLNQQLATYMEGKVQQSSRLTESQLKTISLPSRIRNAIAWLFSPYL
ncbi:MAG: phosphatidylserine/phosphatidylglycerophosphate/cardiolipin synthase family protein, partial [Gammaproteobacteria bacterium]|nr:phosphatidylserine/phosphatidylglycerophosphate/cardiolipin synthase family protein [Gammaproteobacteria bacterium]